MSLILEALKKSERQRRLGEMPNLGTPVLAARRRRSLLPWLVGAIVLALAAGAWLRFAPGSGEPPVERVAEAAPRPAPADAAPQRAASPAPAATSPAPAAAPARPQVGAAPAVPLPSSDDRPGSVAELPVSPLVAGPRKPPADAAATSPPAAVPRPAPPATAPVATAQAPAKPATAKPPATTPAAGAPGAVVATANQPAAAKPVTRPAAAKPAEPALPLVWDVPYAVRKDLPPLALTMHVYSSVPTERFVVVEGERRVEGEDLAEGVVLRQIRSDGIVIDFKGQRFLYPRDGR